MGIPATNDCTGDEGSRNRVVKRVASDRDSGESPRVRVATFLRLVRCLRCEAMFAQPGGACRCGKESGT